MTKEEFITELEDIFQLDEGTLDVSQKLEDTEEWDSMAALALIGLFDSMLSKELPADEITRFETIEDIIKFAGL
ncbi:MAG: acyl carrier protein [Desulfobacteraceae bacterium]|nr:acyl carrier protein [Desulfobacteraceae bacterium]